MATNGTDLVSAIAVTNQQIALLATDLSEAKDADTQQRIADEETALQAHKSTLQDQLRSQGDRRSITALARGRVATEIARDVDNVITEEVANDLALIDRAGDRQLPKKTTDTNVGGSVQDAVRQVTELLAKTGISSGLDALRTILCAGGLQPDKKECYICEVEEDKTVVLRCGHIWCEECVIALYNSVLRDYKTWPAKCCSPIEDGECSF